MNAMGQTMLELPGVPAGRVRTEYWQQVGKFDPRTASLADRHYNRRKIGAPQFMPPGQTLILLSHDEAAVFGWWRPHPDSGIPAINGLDGWTCTIFRNESDVLSSALILDAERALYQAGYDIGPDGLLTYVWDSRVRSVNPGACFKYAGWSVRGRSGVTRELLASAASFLSGVLLVRGHRARCTCHKGGRCAECLAENPDIRPKPQGGKA